MTERADVLSDLLRLRVPLNDAVDRVRALPWDSEEALVLLAGEDIRRVLEAYALGGLTSESVLTWANAIEGRDDVGFEVEMESELRDAIFELANPELSGVLTPARANELIDNFR